MKSYDEEGNVTNYNCNAYTEGSGCATFNEEQYDPNGRHLAAQNRYCVEWNSQGECVRYKQNSGNDHIGIFSENHKQWIRADCKVVETNGICTSYKGGRIEDWDYDENGKTLFYYDNTCSSLSNDLVCSSYSNYKTTTYSYNDTGRTESLCESSVGVNTNCKNITTKTYNSAGKQTSGTVYTCNQWDSNGNCSQYKTGEDHTFTYTTNNKEISHIKNSCSSYDSQNNCLQYSPVSNSYNTYTTNGKTQTSKTTAICNQYTATTCTGGWTVTYIPYVNGKENTSGQTISTCQNFNQSAGECLDQQ